MAFPKDWAVATVFARLVQAPEAVTAAALSRFSGRSANDS
jgi:hypothetical protein